jgi:phage terminase large subunit GpA-like protein
MSTDSVKKASTDWLSTRVDSLTTEIKHQTPVEFNENNRYLPQAVSVYSGYISYDLFPFLVEILNCFDIRSPVREVAWLKAVQCGATTLLESVVFYLACEVKTMPAIFVTADAHMAKARIENNILPTFIESGKGDIFQSSDSTSSRKTGKRSDQLQWIGGGYLLPFSSNSTGDRSYSMPFVLLDEVDTFVADVKKGGDRLATFKDRAAAMWNRRKILMASTPILQGQSNIEREYKRGDQRHYFVPCLGCGEMQYLRWSGVDDETNIEYGIKWEYKEDGTLDADSVHYVCRKCGHKHFEPNKTEMFSRGEWRPTATPIEEGIRSYKLPAFYSPVGMLPWSKCVAQYLMAYNPHTQRYEDLEALQLFYNNILAEPFSQPGAKIAFQAVSGHRRAFYKYGEIPNTHIADSCGAKISFISCTVDVHKGNLAVALFGHTAYGQTWLLYYDRFEGDCEDPNGEPWKRLTEMILDGVYEADDGTKYNIAITLVDSGYNNDLVVDYCSQFGSNVYPIIGRDRPAKNSAIKEFSEFKTRAGTLGYKVVVDHYKDRLAVALRRDWDRNDGYQPRHHFNAPIDATDAQLKELTREYKTDKKMPNGYTTQVWFRPGNARQELWDLLVYAHASVDILARLLYDQIWGSDERIDMGDFYDYIEKNEYFRK